MKLCTLNYFKFKFNISLSDFPFFYKEEYNIYLSKNEKKHISLFCDTNGNSMICKAWKNKFIEIIQPMYPPLNTKGNQLSFNQEKEFILQFINYIQKNKLAQRITQPENFSIFQYTPEKSTKAKFGTYFLSLDQKTEKELFENLHSKHRNVIRNAEKNNVIIKYGKNTLKDFYILYEQTMQRSNMYCQEFSYFENFYNSMPENIICGVAYLNDKPQGALFIPYTQFGAFYLYGASAQNKGINGAINYLHWDAIKLLKSKNVKHYDFVGARLSNISGTKLEGIQQFKERFGTDLKKGFLWKMNINKFDCLVFDILILLKHKLNGLTPPLDIIEEENIKLGDQRSTFNKKIKNKLITEKQFLIKYLRKFKKTIEKPKLLKDLALCGINKGDTILVHSSLSKIGNLSNGSKTIIDALIEHIGVEGNVAMPAYSYIDSMENTAKLSNYLFNPNSSPSKVGKITDEFRKLPGVKRSIHPTHSICAIGPKSGIITEGHLNAVTNFGKNTPFHKIRELNGKIVGLGIDIGPITIYHTIEDFYPELFKDVYLPEPMPINVLVNGKIIPKNISVHNPSFHINRIDKNRNIEIWLHNHFKAKGILHESSFGSGTLWWMNIQQLFNELVSLRKRKITIYKVPIN